MKNNIIFAFDRATARRTDGDGHLHVRSVVTRATVSPYLAEEIPRWRELGLSPGRTYRLYRDPKELEKAAASLAGKPLLFEHKPIAADSHPSGLVVGSVSNPEFKDGAITAELSVWARDAIDAIEDGSRKELSCGYRYTPDMTPGTTPSGQRFDGRMISIQFNHAALVSQGRVPGAVVADSAEPLHLARLARGLSSERTALMPNIEKALRAKYASPRHAMRALGLDEALLNTAPNASENPIEALHEFLAARGFSPEDLEKVDEYVDAIMNGGDGEEEATDEDDLTLLRGERASDPDAMTRGDASRMAADSSFFTRFPDAARIKIGRYGVDAPRPRYQPLSAAQEADFLRRFPEANRLKRG
jgi:hypothetical protein